MLSVKMGLNISKTRVGIYFQPVTVAEPEPVITPRTKVYIEFENITLLNAERAIGRTAHLINLIDERMDLMMMIAKYTCFSFKNFIMVDLRQYDMLKDIKKMTRQLLENANLMKINTLTTSC